MLEKEIESKEELIRNWRRCYIKGLHIKNLKKLIEAYELKIKIWRRI